MMYPRELIVLYKQIESQSKSQKEKENNNDSQFKAKSKLYLHLLNEWDKNKILNFMKDFLKKGRNLNEENLSYTPKLGKEDLKINQDHIQALKELEKARTSGDIQSQYRLIDLISTHYMPIVKSFTRIPNIIGFEIKLSRFHPILKLFGILLRMEKADLDFLLLDKKDRMNRYNDYMFKKLHETRKNPKAFWFYASFLMTRSTLYLVSIIRRVYPTWYKSITLKFVQNLIKDYQNLNLDNFKFNRINIPKPDGSLRPLGIPEPVWRLYQSGLNQIIVIFISQNYTNVERF